MSKFSSMTPLSPLSLGDITAESSNRPVHKVVKSAQILDPGLVLSEADVLANALGG
jgi:hypothetical protein